MKILHHVVPRILGAAIAVAAAVLVSGGCGHGGVSGSDSDLTTATTPAFLGVARDGNAVFLAFYDEEGNPMAVDRASLEESVTYETDLSVGAMAFKAASSDCTTQYIWDRLSTKVKVVPCNLNACTPFELCIGDGVVEQGCMVGGEAVCDPLDIAKCYPIEAGKSSGDLLPDSSGACYDDFVVGLYYPGPPAETLVMLYAGAAEPGGDPAAEVTLDGLRYTIIAGNVDGGDAPIGLTYSASAIAIPLGDEPVPPLDEEHFAFLRGAYYFGFAFDHVADIGDVNGDGFGDILASADTVASVVFGRAFEAGQYDIADFTDLEIESPDQIKDVAGGADINGTPLDEASYDDVVVGLYGYVVVYYGGAELDTDYDAVIESEQSGDKFGYATVDTGDVDGDGYADILAAAPQHDSPKNSDVGAVYLFRGGKDPFATELSASKAWMKITGDEKSEVFGAAITFLGDVNGDGYGDFAAYGGGVGVTDPKVSLFLGESAAALKGTWDRGAKETLAIVSEDGKLQNLTAALGDINGDGAMDFAVRHNLTPLAVPYTHIDIFLGGEKLAEKIAAAGADKVIDVSEADVTLIYDASGVSEDGIQKPFISGRVRK